jgi:putative PIN family toxin of toxin-antitoxin system
MRIVIDTNILVSALLNPYGKPAAVLGLVLEEKATICFDSRIIAEYRDVLKRPKFGFSAKGTADLLEFLTNSGMICTPGPEKVDETHADDLPFAQVSLAIDADYLITGNTNHFPRRIGRTSVVNPSAFIDKFYSGKSF